MEAPIPDPAALVIPATAALVHAYVGVGLELLLTILYVFDTLLHQLTVEALIITAVGLTVIATFFGVPSQLFIVGVITYVTRIGSVVEFTNASVMAAPEPEPVAGAIPGTDALVHE